MRENQRAVVEFLLENDAGAAYEAGDSLLAMAREREYTELAALFESKLKELYDVVHSPPPSGTVTRLACVP